MICRCGKHTEVLNSYFHKENKLRITVCDDCAMQSGLKDEKKYEVIPINKLTAEQNKTPEPNANN